MYVNFKFRQLGDGFVLSQAEVPVFFIPTSISTLERNSLAVVHLSSGSPRHPIHLKHTHATRLKTKVVIIKESDYDKETQ
jgi:hypothetical protein